MAGRQCALEMVGLAPSEPDAAFWSGRRVLLTGHTGFKGAWMSLLLESLGAEVTGVALPPPSNPSLYDILSPWPRLVSHTCDVRRYAQLASIVGQAAPQVVIHMAAQPLVLESYADPIGTFETNVLGSVHLLEALRPLRDVQCALMITSDKVYANEGSAEAFRESAPLGGLDPYSASKACTEIASAAYSKSFLRERGTVVLTARAGNIIGGGDWGAHRLVPDLWRAFSERTPAEIRFPEATRPWQHVFEPLCGYLIYIERAVSGANLPPALNFGPARGSVWTVAEVADAFANVLQTPRLWRPTKRTREEAKSLAVDATLAATCLNWTTRLGLEQMVEWTARWYQAFRAGSPMRQFSLAQLRDYFDVLRASRGRASVPAS